VHPSHTSTSGNCVLASFLNRSEKQPATASVVQTPDLLNLAISRMASMASCLASLINAHVLTIIVFAREKSDTARKPALQNRPRIVSPSMWFLLQPRL